MFAQQTHLAWRNLGQILSILQAGWALTVVAMPGLATAVVLLAILLLADC
jgi:hypothetical protein